REAAGPGPLTLAPKRPNVAFGASSAPNATLGASNAPNATLGRLSGLGRKGWIRNKLSAVRTLRAYHRVMGYEAFVSRLRDLLGKSAVLTDSDVTDSYARDMMPLAPSG